MKLTSGCFSSIISQMPGIFFVKDSNSKYLFSNEEFSKKSGFKKADELIGKSDFELKCPAASLAEQFQSQDKDALKHEQISFLNICHFNDGTPHLLLGTKTKFFNQDDNSFGIISVEIDAAKTIYLTNINKIIEHSKKYFVKGEQCVFRIFKNTSTPDKFLKENLTIRELECLFYLARGMTAKEAAIELRLSNRTVEKHLANLKEKFSCSSKSHLISKAIENGFLFNLPFSFLCK